MFFNLLFWTTLAMSEDLKTKKVSNFYPVLIVMCGLVIHLMSGFHSFHKGLIVATFYAFGSAFFGKYFRWGKADQYLFIAIGFCLPAIPTWSFWFIFVQTVTAPIYVVLYNLRKELPTNSLVPYIPVFWLTLLMLLVLFP